VELPFWGKKKGSKRKKKKKKKKKKKNLGFFFWGIFSPPSGLNLKGRFFLVRNQGDVKVNQEKVTFR